MTFVRRADNPPIALWSRGHYASAMVWTTPKRITTGFQVDSVADSWYAPFIGKTKGILLEKDFTDAPWGWSGVDKKWLGFRYVRNDAWCPKAQLIWSYPTARSCAIFIPHWAIASLTAILPAMAIAIRAKPKPAP